MVAYMQSQANGGTQGSSNTVQSRQSTSPSMSGYYDERTSSGRPRSWYSSAQYGKNDIPDPNAVFLLILHDDDTPRRVVAAGLEQGHAAARRQRRHLTADQPCPVPRSGIWRPPGVRRKWAMSASPSSALYGMIHGEGG